MNWLDWLIVAVVAISALQGLHRGLLASLAGLAGLLVGLFVANSYYRPLAEYLAKNWNMTEKVKPLVTKLLKLWMPSQSYVQNAIQPGKAAVAGGVVPGQLPNAADYLAGSLTSMVLEAACFVALLLATSWAINVAGAVLTKVAQFSLLGVPNRLGGLLFGIVRGLAIVIIILTLLAPFQSAVSLYGSRPGTPGAAQRRANPFASSILLPYFEPLFNAIGHPLNNDPTVILKDAGYLRDC